MDLLAKKEGNCTVVYPGQRMDAVSAPEFEKKIGEMIDGGEKNFVLNFKDLEYVSSAGLRSVLSSAKRAKAKGGDIMLCEMKGSAEEVFKMTGFFNIFKVFASEAEAVTKFV